MSQFTTSTQIRRRGGDLDVYTGLLLVATIVLAIGVAILCMTNNEHSSASGQGGGLFTLVNLQ
ncbi:MAG: hypothetical protein ACR2GY_11185 [Phycisphaerales bacterium]